MPKKYKIILLFCGLLIAILAVLNIGKENNAEVISNCDIDTLRSMEYTGKVISKKIKIYFCDQDLLADDTAFYYFFKIDFRRIKRGDTISFVCDNIKFINNGKFDPARKINFRKKYYLENGYINTDVIFTLSNFQNEMIYSYKLTVENKEQIGGRNIAPYIGITVNEYCNNNSVFKMRGIDGYFDDVPELKIFSTGLHELQNFNGVNEV